MIKTLWMRAPLHVEFGSWPGRVKEPNGWRCGKGKAPASGDANASLAVNKKRSVLLAIAPTITAALEGPNVNVFSTSGRTKSNHSRSMTTLDNHYCCCYYYYYDRRVNTTNYLSSCSARVSNAIIAGQQPDYGLELEGNDQSFFGALQQRSTSSQDALR